MKLTITVIAITFLIFGMQMGGIIGNDFAFMPADLLNKPYTIVTAIFLHSGAQHILLNMLGLFVFGSIVEQELSWKHWIFLYITSGIFGNLGYMLLSNPFIPVLGASGAIFGLMGAAAILKPKQIIYTPYGPFPMFIAAIMWGVTEIISFFGVDNIAQSAHIFGLVSGALIIYGYKKGLSTKIFYSILIVLLVAIFAIAISLPHSINGFKPSTNSCKLNNSIEQINFKEYVYQCKEGLIVSVSYPSSSKIDVAKYYKNFPHETEKIHSSTFNDKCNATIDKANIQNGSLYITGKICNHKFYDIAKNCGFKRVELIQIYNETPPIKEINC